MCTRLTQSLLTCSLNLSLQRIASAAQLHAAQVIATSGKASPEVVAVLRLLSGTPDHGASTQLITLLGIVSALSAYRGSFTGRQARQAVAHVIRQSNDRAAWVDQIRLMLLLRKLRRLGLIPKMRLDGVHYTFHEAIAQLCVDRLASVKAFEGPFRQTIFLRLHGRLQKENPAVQWMLASEIGEESVMSDSFDAAAELGAFRPMASCLERCSKRIQFSDEIRLEFALVLDRVGEFSASRAEFDERLAASLAPNSQLAAQLVIARTEVMHDEQAVAELELLRSGADRFVALTARYWEIHIKAHAGVFEPDELLLLESEAMSLVAEDPSYFELHSLARMHFDGLRLMYLAGRATPSLVHATTNGGGSRYLRSRLATYDALTTLYTRAHLLGHVLLPMVAIFKDSVTSGEAGVGGDPELQVEVSALVEATRLEYSRARNEFWQFGDREAQYIQADILNAELVSTEVDFGRVEGLLLQYKRFIELSGFGEMASYPYLYLFRWNVLKRFALLLNPTPDLRPADEYLDEARRCLQFAESLDEKVNNRYGLFRARLLRLLLDGVTEPLGQGSLDELRVEAEECNYGFEVRLLRHLREQSGLRPADLREVLRFYPIVHQ